MAYGRRRRSTRSSGYGRRSSYRAAPRRRSTGRRRSRVSRGGGSRTIRLVIQTVPGASAGNSGQAAALPMRAMF